MFRAFKFIFLNRKKKILNSSGVNVEYFIIAELQKILKKMCFIRSTVNRLEMSM